MTDPLLHLGRLFRKWAAPINPWTNVYGLARTLLATGTAATLACNHSTTLFRPVAGISEVPYCEGLSRVGFFCLASHHLELARWTAFAILLVVASGWSPRFTGWLHWWLSFSLATSAVTVDGGDQVSSVLTLLLLPVTLSDGRKWHWQTSDLKPTRWEDLKRLVALSALLATRIQVAGIYFHAAVGKLRVQEWTDGTALYYWFQNPDYGATPLISRLLAHLLLHGTTIALMTWGAIALEFSLFMALVMPKKDWRYLLPLGIAFHTFIAVIHGLVSFGFAMTAALVLYLRPIDEPFRLACVLPTEEAISVHVVRAFMHNRLLRNTSRISRRRCGREDVSGAVFRRSEGPPA
jgi:antimicrobial peptide system SdpB family protein